MDLSLKSQSPVPSPFDLSYREREKRPKRNSFHSPSLQSSSLVIREEEDSEKSEVKLASLSGYCEGLPTTVKIKSCELHRAVLGQKANCGDPGQIPEGGGPRHKGSGSREAWVPGCAGRERVSWDP